MKGAKMKTRRDLPFTREEEEKGGLSFAINEDGERYPVSEVEEQPVAMEKYRASGEKLFFRTYPHAIPNCLNRTVYFN